MHQRKLSEKLRRVSQIIETWLDAGRPTPREQEEASVPSLLGTVLQKRVLTPENLSSYEEPGRTDGSVSSVSPRSPRSPREAGTVGT
jgi:hypothetical protein